MQKVLAIVGPTAVGKTALSLELGRRFSGEVISGDSMQVYCGLDIGTAKATPAERAQLPHHLIDICQPSERYSVAQFKAAASDLIESIGAARHLPMIVGGTGFYLQSLTHALALGNDHFDDQSAAIRQRWHDVADREGKEKVWQALNAQDPAAAAKIPVANLRRVIRALEVIEKTGKPFSAQPQYAPAYDFFIIGLTTARSGLYQRNNDRVDQMVAAGLVDEARRLYEAGGEALPAGKGIGYRELFPYFEGRVSLAAAIEKVKLDSRHYAKRQLTWFRNQEDCHWFDLVSQRNTTAEIEAVVSTWLKK